MVWRSVDLHGNHEVQGLIPDSGYIFSLEILILQHPEVLFKFNLIRINQLPLHYAKALTELPHFSKLNNMNYTNTINYHNVKGKS